MIIQAVRDLYLSIWGPPSRHASFRVAEAEIEVLKWNAEENPEGVNLYTTVGASAFALPGRDADHRIEFFTGLLPDRDDIASPLAALALYPMQEGVALDHGHTVLADRPLWPGTDMRRLLIVRPIAEILAPLELPGGLHVDFLQAIPIFESELTYKTQQGPEALLRRWERSNVPFWDPDRSPEPAVN